MDDWAPSLKAKRASNYDERQRKKERNGGEKTAKLREKLREWDLIWNFTASLEWIYDELSPRIMTICILQLKFICEREAAVCRPDAALRYVSSSCHAGNFESNFAAPSVIAVASVRARDGKKSVSQIWVGLHGTARMCSNCEYVAQCPAESGLKCNTTQQERETLDSRFFQGLCSEVSLKIKVWPRRWWDTMSKVIESSPKISCNNILYYTQYWKYTMYFSKSKYELFPIAILWSYSWSILFFNSEFAICYFLISRKNLVLNYLNTGPNMRIKISLYLWRTILSMLLRTIAPSHEIGKIQDAQFSRTSIPSKLNKEMKWLTWIKGTVVVLSSTMTFYSGTL